jgi:hypothetical protein
MSVKLWTACASLILAVEWSALAQGTIVYGIADALHYRGDEDHLLNIDVNADGLPDFTLISRNGGILLSSLETASIGVLGQNKIITTDDSILGACYLVGFQEGSLIGSSLLGGYIWYDPNTDNMHQAIIGMASDAGCVNLLGAGISYVGFDLCYGGANHYGWMRFYNPSIFPVGDVLDWAYQTTPNTPILAGTVPEPSTCTLMVCFGACGWLFLCTPLKAKSAK